MAKKSAAERAYELGKYYEKTYMGCSQCALAALQDVFDMRDDSVFKAATALAAGGARTTQGSCGAYVGALLFLGSVVGRERDKFDDPEGIRLKTQALAKQLYDRFIQEYGSVVCSNIQTKTMGRPFYLVDPDEFKKFEKSGAHDIYCPEVVGKSARWATEIILAAGQLPEPEPT